MTKTELKKKSVQYFPCPKLIKKGFRGFFRSPQTCLQIQCNKIKRVGEGYECGYEKGKRS
jgi:hypothetical protein